MGKLKRIVCRYGKNVSPSKLWLSAAEGQGGGSKVEEVKLVKVFKIFQEALTCKDFPTKKREKEQSI